MPSKQVMIAGGVGVTALVAFSALFASIVSGRRFGPPERLRFAMELLDQGRWDLAGRIARDQEEAGSVIPDEDSVWQYVSGVSKLHSVMEELDTPKNREVLLEATEHLRKADELGFPLGYQGKGRYYLGVCLFHTYRWNEAIDKLLLVPEQWPEMRSEALRMIVSAQLQKKPPDYRAAKISLDQWNSIPGMSRREQAVMQMMEARFAFATNAFEKCEQLLAGVSDELPEYFEAMLWRGRWRVELAERPVPLAQRMKLAQEAAAILREVIVAADTSNEMRRQATYLSGRNQRLQGKLEEALGTFSGVHQRSPHSAEAVAAGIEEAEILQEAENFAGAVNTVHHILRNIGNIRLYNGYWLSEDQLKMRLLDLGRRLRNAGEYDRVIELADYLGLAFSKSDTVRMQAETFEVWGDDLAAQPLSAHPVAREERRQLLNDKYRRAADAFAELATLEMRSNEYLQIVWQSAENYRKANDLDKANRQLEEYLRNEERTKRARGFVALGRNHIHAGEWQQAIDPLDRCLTEYATNPVSYEARLLAAQANVELGQLDTAVELLESNLADFQLDPTSPIWQDSLYELGEISFNRGDEMLLRASLPTAAQGSAGQAVAGQAGVNAASNELEEQLRSSHDAFLAAVKRLREAYSRYPDDPRSFPSRYLLARSYRMASKMPELIVKANANLVDSARRDLLQQRRDLLEKALEEYRALHLKISDRTEVRGATEDLNALARNCYFGEADTLYELAQWEDAITAYRAVASRYLNQPESLEALVQLALCHRKLGREAEAKKTLAQAEQVLKRIPAEQDGRFVSYTRASRPEWEKLLSWMQQWN